MGHSTANRLSAAFLGARKEIFVVTDDGTLSWTLQSEGVPEGQYGEWQPLVVGDVLELSDVAASETPTGGLKVFALAKDGEVWTAAQAADGHLGAWELLGEVGPPGQMHSLTSGYISGGTLAVFGVGSDRWVYHTRSEETGWSAWASVDAL